jgi:hypothetical protein
MVTLAVDVVLDVGLRPTVTELTLGEVHGVGPVVGPHTAKVTVPVGAPEPAFPVTAAVSTAELP